MVATKNKHRSNMAKRGIASRFYSTGNSSNVLAGG